MKKAFRRIAIVFFVCIIASTIAAWFILPKIILQPTRYSREQILKIFPHGLEPSVYGMQYEDFDVITQDSVNLDGLLIHPDKEPQGTIVMIHGIGAYKEVFYHLAKKLSEEGYQIVLTDLRAMGQSGGQYCTYGWLEKQDIHRIVSKIKTRFPDLPVALYGTSLGGSIALQAMANNQQIDAGIIECTYDELRNVVRAYTARTLGFTCNILADFALWRASEEGQFDASLMNPCDFAKSITQPVFIAHGDQDIHIPIAFGRHNYEMLIMIWEKLVAKHIAMQFFIFCAPD
jgi:uncharacterized protein